MTIRFPAELAVAQCGVLHRRQLRAAGIDRRAVAGRVRRGELTEIANDVFLVAGTPETWHQRLWTGLLTARPGALISHRAAAGLRNYGRFGEEFVDVLEVENTDHRLDRATGHRTSWLPPHHRSLVGTIPVTSPGRTIFDLAGLASTKRWVRGWSSVRPTEVARALDDALLSGVPLADVREAFDTLAKRGRPGTVLMRELLDERGEDQFAATESELEDLVIRILVEYDMDLPERQRVIGGTEAPIGRVDFAYPDARVVIEADGRRFHGTLLDSDRDRWRDLELAAAGWLVIRVRYRQLIDEPGRFVRRLQEVLDVRAA